MSGQHRGGAAPSWRLRRPPGAGSLAQVRGRGRLPRPRRLPPGVWIVYPAIKTIWRSLFDRCGDKFVGLDNYKNAVHSDQTLNAIKNNPSGSLIVPAFVTAIGLIFAVLTERVRWSVAFKTAVFMPMAVSAFAAGVIGASWTSKDRTSAP